MAVAVHLYIFTVTALPKGAGLNEQPRQRS